MSANTYSTEGEQGGPELLDRVLGFIQSYKNNSPSDREDNRMQGEPEQSRFESYPARNDYGDYDQGNDRPYSPDGHDRRDRERTRDRERRRERRRREREKDRNDRPDRDYHSRDYGGDNRERSRDRHRTRESRFSDINEHSRDRRDAGHDDDNEYSHGEGFYEEGGYIDHPGHFEEDYHSRNSRSRDSRDHDRDRDRDRERDRERIDRDRPGGSLMTDTPTHTILLRGLPQQVDENDIKAELMLFGAPIRDVRLMKKKETGVSRGFAFVEFQNLTDAQRWMDHNQGRLTLLNQYRVYMYYSMPKVGRPGDPAEREPRPEWRADWTCGKCAYHNFKRRDHCFKCNIPREDSTRVKEGDGFDQVGNNPCNTLIFRGLDALTVEENLITALSLVTAIPVKNAKIIRDDLTGTSLGFGFAEFGSLAESSQMLEVIQNSPTPFEVDGKAIIVAYAKNTFSTTMATMNHPPGQQAQQAQYDYSQYGQYDANTGMYYDAKTGQYYDPNTGQYYDYATYYQQVTGTQPPTQNSTNAAAAVAQAALQAQAAKQISKQKTPPGKKPSDNGARPISEWPTPSAESSGTEYAKYPTPDVSTYQYDETSGYYYDPGTGLYYDANTQYYYNSTTDSFMYWDGEKQTYLPAPGHESSAQGAASNDKVGDKKEDDKGKKEKKEDKKEKVKVAKKIAKDMEKWAKTLNAQKEAMREGFKKTMFGPSRSDRDREAASADAGFAILEKVKAERATGADSFKGTEDKQLMPPPPPMGGKESAGQPGLVASYGGDSEEDDDDDVNMLGANDEDKLLDWNKMACLLCKRQFPSKEALQRHQQLSDLHKTNLENFRKSRGPESGMYRDRAKERRAKYGKAAPPLPNKVAQANAPIPFEQPTKQGLTNDNVGNKLLQKMGWSQGEGLGKAKQGMTTPVETTLRQAQAGLGARGSNYNIQPGETYKEVAKKAMFARYNEIE